VYSPSTSTGFLIVCSGRMPGKSKEYWAIGTVVVSDIASIVQKFGDPVVDLESIYISINSRVENATSRYSTNLLIVPLGGDEVDSNLGRLSTGLQSRFGTLDSIFGTVDVPGDTANGRNTDTGPK